jgi:ubiquinone biosynthesis protein COQ4
VTTPLASAFPIDLRGHPRRPRRRWRDAVRALRRLLAHPDETHLALEIVHALDPARLERGFARLAASASGRRLAFERPSLLAALSDRARLEALPDGSLGRAYLAHVDRYGLDPVKLVGLQRERFPELVQEPALAWFADRSALLHDVAHVVAGYGADELGEATLLWWSLAQWPSAPNALLAVGAALRAWRDVGRGWPTYVWTAWRRGRRTAPLDRAPWEEWLALPLDDVRRALCAGTPEAAHPRGVLRGDPVRGGATAERL